MDIAAEFLSAIINAFEANKRLADRDPGRPAGAHRRRAGEAGLQGEASRGLNEDR